jgi:ribosome-associated protein
MSSVCDYFVIASGTSTTHVRAIADNIERRLKEKGQRVWHTEGEREALWVLLDCGDVVVHVFLDQTRRFYDLERLWADAPQTRFKEAGPKGRTKPRPKAGKKSSRPPTRVKKRKAAKRRYPRKRR